MYNMLKIYQQLIYNLYLTSESNYTLHVVNKKYLPLKSSCIWTFQNIFTLSYVCEKKSCVNNQCNPQNKNYEIKCTILLLNLQEPIDTKYTSLKRYGSIHKHTRFQIRIRYSN